VVLTKKLITGIIILAAVLTLKPALAATGFYTPDLLPSSPIYFLKTWKESLELFFTLDKEKKVETLAIQAERRLAEAKSLLDKNLPIAAKAAVARYQDTYNLALGKVSGLGSMSKKSTALENLSNNTNFELRVVADLYDSAPNNVKEDIATLVAAVSKTQSEIVNTASSEIRAGIIKKIEDGREEILTENTSVKSILPVRVLPH
jgi:hypothetical protein